MKVKALRGVCIGVDRHLMAGDFEDLEPALVTFLVGIGAVERVKEEPPKPEAPAPEPEPAKSEPIKPVKVEKASGSKEK